jgi:hypothetical protein
VTRRQASDSCDWKCDSCGFWNAVKPFASYKAFVKHLCGVKAAVPKPPLSIIEMQVRRGHSVLVARCCTSSVRATPLNLLCTLIPCVRAAADSVQRLRQRAAVGVPATSVRCQVPQRDIEANGAAVRVDDVPHVLELSTAAVAVPALLSRERQPRGSHRRRLR